ncbi:amidase [Prosthecobacter sp.]|uniref:amidase n=1 Tax=Prosthecobacter sp. TaxID=1965333 RepID=UPI002ABD07B8|nr:amidase [Prosthecobacter sp.]MDZ4405376.1 amidase [Prosthecobacter sp.]
MLKPLHALASWLLLALGLIVCSSGCVVPPKRPAGSSRDHTFIAYWPPPRNSQRLKLAIKDNIDMRGVVTTAGSEHLARNSPPAARDAACLAIARQRGVHIVGKVNLSEFAVAPSGINDYFGTPANPFNSWRKYVPGGSSCGSACAVAAGKADIAFGTDTGGSVRVPAACCGVVGLKTTFGLVSLKGVFPISPQHLDTVGPLALDVAGVARGMDLLQRGFAARYAAAVKNRPAAKAIKIGRLVLRGTDPKIDQAVDDALARAGFEVIILEDALRVKWEQAHKDGTTIAAAGAWISDRQFSAKLGVSARTRSIIFVGGVAYSTQYHAALARQADWRRTLRQVFKQVDFIALPTLQAPPPPMPPTLRVDLLRAEAEIANLQNINALNPLKVLSDVPATGLRLLGIDLFEAKMLNLQNTVAVNFAGNPALALPVPLPRGRVPVTSLQLIGPPLSEAELLATGRLIEASR